MTVAVLRHRKRGIVMCVSSSDIKRFSMGSCAVGRVPLALLLYGVAGCIAAEPVDNASSTNRGGEADFGGASVAASEVLREEYGVASYTVEHTEDGYAVTAFDETSERVSRIEMARSNQEMAVYAASDELVATLEPLDVVTEGEERTIRMRMNGEEVEISGNPDDPESVRVTMDSEPQLASSDVRAIHMWSDAMPEIEESSLIPYDDCVGCLMKGGATWIMASCCLLSANAPCCAGALWIGSDVYENCKGACASEDETQK